MKVYSHQCRAPGTSDTRVKRARNGVAKKTTRAAPGLSVRIDDVASNESPQSRDARLLQLSVEFLVDEQDGQRAADLKMLLPEFCLKSPNNPDPALPKVELDMEANQVVIKALATAAGPSGQSLPAQRRIIIEDPPRSPTRAAPWVT